MPSRSARRGRRGGRPPLIPAGWRRRSPRPGRRGRGCRSPPFRRSRRPRPGPSSPRSTPRGGGRRGRRRIPRQGCWPCPARGRSGLAYGEAEPTRGPARLAFVQPGRMPPFPPRNGRFVTLEGPEGAGKTVIARRLVAALEGQGASVLSTREPGGTRLGERLRELLLANDGSPISTRADALLFNAARAQLVGEVIGPALDAGQLVICARFADSTLAYQGYGAGVSLDDLRALADIATGGLEPDLTHLLDVPPAGGVRRQAEADPTRLAATFDPQVHRRVPAG